MNNKQIVNRKSLNSFRSILRNKSISVETELWYLQMSGKLEGRKFRRQHSISNYKLNKKIDPESTTPAEKKTHCQIH